MRGGGGGGRGTHPLCLEGGEFLPCRSENVERLSSGTRTIAHSPHTHTVSVLVNIPGQMRSRACVDSLGRHRAPGNHLSPARVDRPSLSLALTNPLDPLSLLHNESLMHVNHILQSIRCFISTFFTPNHRSTSTSIARRSFTTHNMNGLCRVVVAAVLVVAAAADGKHAMVVALHVDRAVPRPPPTPFRVYLRVAPNRVVPTPPLHDSGKNSSRPPPLTLTTTALSPRHRLSTPTNACLTRSRGSHERIPGAILAHPPSVCHTTHTLSLSDSTHSTPHTDTHANLTPSQHHRLHPVGPSPSVRSPAPTN